MVDSDIKDRFEENLWKLKSCWFWQGPKQHNRTYLFVYVDGKRKRKSARRISWELYKNEPLEDDIMVKTTCMQSFCVNPDHLYLVLRTYSWRSG